MRAGPDPSGLRRSRRPRPAARPLLADRPARLSRRLIALGVAALTAAAGGAEGERPAPPPEPWAIAEIVFEGNEAFGAARLRRAMKPRGGGLPGAWRRGRVYDAETLERDLAAVRDLYRRRGYKDVVLGGPRFEPLAEGGPYRLTIPVDEGRRWPLGGISVQGNRTISDQRLLAAFPQPRPAWLDRSAIDAWAGAARDLYRALGRIDTRVTPEVREREERADVYLRIEEGEVLRVGRIEIAGNTRTRDEVLRRALGLREGEVLDLTAVERGLEEMRRRRIFLPEESEPIRLEESPSAPGVVDLTLRGREARPVDVGFGGGWSEVYGLSLRAGIGSANFLGRGETFALRLETGGTREGAELYYTVPWLLDRPQSVHFELFDRESDYRLGAGQGLLRDETGGSLTFARSLGRRQGIRLRLSGASFVDRQSRADGGVSTQRLSPRQAGRSLLASWTRDGRDDALDPQSGLQVTVTAESAGGLLGGDTRYLRSEADFSWFRPLGRSPARPVFAARLAAGRIEPHGGAALSPLDAYFLGGNRSVRGFATRSLSARGPGDELLEDELGFLRGGTRFIEAGVELRLPLLRRLRLVPFADAGNVFASEQSLDLGRLRATAGLELRLRLPRLETPLRLIWAAQLDPLPGDRFEDLQIAFGTAF